MQLNGHRRQHGGTLVEALISVLILSFSVLGLLGLQNAAVAYQRVAYQQVQATGLANALGELARSNPQGFAAGGYAWERSYQSGSTPASHQCTLVTPCDPAALAAGHVGQWLQAVRSALPGGDAYVRSFPAQGVVDVWIMWQPSQSALVLDTRGTCMAAALAGVTEGQEPYCVFVRIRT